MAVDRAARAATLTVEHVDGERHVVRGGQSDHLVDLADAVQCDCKDYEFTPGVRCAHLIAVDVFRANGQPAPVDLPPDVRPAGPGLDAEVPPPAPSDDDVEHRSPEPPGPRPGGSARAAASARQARFRLYTADELLALLRPYVFGADRPPAQLLFPSFRTGKERMLVDVRKLLDRVSVRLETLYVMDGGHRRRAEPAEIRTKAFRHTYISARLQTLDHGAPVSPWSVAREVGHSGTQMIDRIYGHLGEVRHRAKAVEYRVRQHGGRLRGRLELVA